jgi:hypothetical protein
LFFLLVIRMIICYKVMLNKKKQHENDSQNQQKEKSKMFSE